MPHTYRTNTAGAALMNRRGRAKQELATFLHFLHIRIFAFKHTTILLCTLGLYASHIGTLPLTHTTILLHTLGLCHSHIGTLALAHTDFAAHTLGL